MGENAAIYDMFFVQLLQNALKIDVLLKEGQENILNNGVVLTFYCTFYTNKHVVNTRRCNNAVKHMVLVRPTPHDHGRNKDRQFFDPACGPCGAV